MADQPGLLNQPPQDQPWYGGLLDMFKQGYNPAAAYQGDLNSPATQSAMRWRALAGAAEAGAQAAMPVPYKGGTPWGSFLGMEAGGAYRGEDALVAARLQNAQAEQQRQATALAQQRFNFIQQIAPGLLSSYLGQGGAGQGGTGTGKGGPPDLMGRARAVASQTADTSLPPQARALLDTISGPESGGAYNVRWGGPGGDKTFDSYAAHPNIPEPGPEGNSTAAGRYQIVNSTWQPLQKKYGFTDFSPVTQDQAAWHLASDTYKEKTGRDLLTDLQNGDTSRVAGALHGQWATLNMGAYAPNLSKYEQGGPQVASAGGGTAGYGPNATGVVAGPDGVMRDIKTGQPVNPATGLPTGGAAPAAAGPPMAPRAAPPSLLSPQGAAAAASSAVPPQLMTPPAPPAAAPAPGPQGALPGRPPQGLLAMAAPQTMNDASSAASQLLGGPAGVQLAQAGGVAPQPSAAPPAPVPHTGAGGAAELQGLLAPPPAGPAPAPPAGGPGGPGGPPGAAPVPAAPPMPPAPPAAPPVPAMPQQGPIPGAPTPEEVKRAQAGSVLFPLLGLPVPPSMTETAKFPMVGPTAQATAAGTAAGQYPTQAALQQQKAEYDLWVKRMEPQIVRPGSYVRDPTTGQMAWNPEVQKIIDKQGNEFSYYVYPPATADGLPRWVPIGQTKLGPQQQAYGTGVGTAQAGNTPLPAPATAPPAAPGAAQYPGTPLAPNMNSKMPDYQEPNYTGDQLKAYAPEWVKANSELTSVIGASQAAELRLQDIAAAFKEVQTGRWLTDKAAFNAAMTSIFGQNAPQMFANASPDKVEQALHANYRATLQTLSEVNKRFTNNEFKVTSETSESPELQPAANLQMLSQDIGQLRQLRALGNDWVQARIEGKQDPSIFAAKWMSENPLKPITEAVAKEIGPLKGMETGAQAVPKDLPQGTTYGGQSPDGRPYYLLPNGQAVRGTQR